ncbi:pyridoxal phosphate-dependent aminotransferase [Ciceribacter selenitireducens]
MEREHKLAIGDLDGSPHPDLVQAFHTAINEPGASHYPSPLGLASTRSKVADYFASAHGVELGPKGVLITHGALPAIYFGLQTAGRQGRPCGFFKPYFNAFPAAVAGSGMLPVPIPLPNGRLQKKDIRDHFRMLRGGVFLLNNPLNPTGRVFDLDELLVTGDVCREFDIRILSDAVYNELYETERPISLIGLEPTAIEAISISKTFGACGYRVGAVVGNPNWIASVADRYAVLNGVPYAAQRMAEYAWSHMPGVSELRKEIASRRVVVVEALRAIGFTVDTERQNLSSMFVWAQLPERSAPASLVAQRSEAFGVHISNGEIFGDESGRFIRIALNEPSGQLAEAMSRLTFAMGGVNEAA